MVKFIISDHLPPNYGVTALQRRSQMEAHHNRGLIINENFQIERAEVNVSKDIFGDEYRMWVHRKSPLTNEYGWHERWFTFDMKEAKEVLQDILDAYLGKLESETQRIINFIEEIDNE